MYRKISEIVHVHKKILNGIWYKVPVTVKLLWANVPNFVTCFIAWYVILNSPRNWVGLGVPKVDMLLVWITRTTYRGN